MIFHKLKLGRLSALFYTCALLAMGFSTASFVIGVIAVASGLNFIGAEDAASMAIIGALLCVAFTSLSGLTAMYQRVGESAGSRGAESRDSK